MDSAIALALMAKAKLVFESDDTFISFPLSPVAYTPRQLDFVSEGFVSDDLLASASDFSRLVNQIPTGVIWTPTVEKYLWDVYRDVLTTAKRGSSVRTAEEQARYDAAFAVLHEIGSDGLWQDSVMALSYDQYRDAWFAAKQEYGNKKVEAALSKDPAVKQRWNEIDEPKLRAQIASVEEIWIAKGFKDQVESARQTLTALNSKSSVQIWGQWQGAYDAGLDNATDANKLSFAPSAFSPYNVIGTGAWQKFTLTDDEAEGLAGQAPAELKSRLAPDQTDLDIELLSFEYSSVQITRPWFTSDVFKSNFWKFDDAGKLLSDGGNPAQGLCPAYAVALVLARNVQIQLKSGSQRNDQTMDRLKVGGKLSLGVFEFAPGAVTGGKPWLIGAQVPSRAAKFERAEAPATSMRSSGLATSALNSRMTAHVATSASARDLGSARMSAGSKAAIQFRGKDYVKLYKPGTGEVPPSAPPPSPSPSPGPATEPKSDEIYVMGFICKRIPRSPNPDPQLQW